tara:strand:+ start:378 stop:542 length:165 start_codon:yes stop_codon:yes gene_type:complete
MATYKELKGTSIQLLSSDPSNPIVGQIWFNTSTNLLKGRVLVGSTATTVTLTGS